MEKLTDEILKEVERRLEMYARNQHDGWDCWGNEV